MPTKARLIAAKEDGSLDEHSLFTYAVAGRVDFLASYAYDRELRSWHRRAERLTRKGIGRELGLGATRLSEIIERAVHLPRARLLEFEHQLLLFGLASGADESGLRGLGWLSSFRNELLGGFLTGPDAGAARYVHDLAEAGPTNSADALVLGEGLVSLMASAKSSTAAMLIWNAWGDDAETAARSLVSVATRPPGGGSVPAIQLAAQLGVHVLPFVEEQVTRSPVGFRATRILTRMLKVARTPPAWWSTDGIAERAAVWNCLKVLDDKRDRLPDPYPARSFWAEACREVLLSQEAEGRFRDEAWTRFQDRLTDASRPWRERSYIAWSQVVDFKAYAGARDALHKVEDPTEGLSYVLSLMGCQHAGENVTQDILSGTSTSNRVEIGRATDIVNSATGGGRRPVIAGLPSSIAAGTEQLVRLALLTPDGTIRRRCCETLREAGFAQEAAMMLLPLLKEAHAPAWLREIAAFTASYLLSPVAENELIEATLDPAPGVSHAATFGLGDLAYRTGDVIAALLKISSTLEGRTPEVAQACAYALAVLRPAGENQTARQEQLDALSWLQFTGDTTTTLLASWGLDGVRRLEMRRRLADTALIWGSRAVSPLEPPSPP
jgi:hypothetical protein